MILSITEQHNAILKAKVCPYCGGEPKYVDSIEIYGTSYGMAYWCKPCDAYVGVHKGTSNPLGRLANKELREWKKKAHAAFDPLWKSGKMKRASAYKWLASQLLIEAKYVHIGNFGIETCKRVIALSEKYKKNHNIK